MNLIEALTIIADKYHNKIVGQKRKYTGENYTNHVHAVEKIYTSIAPDDIAGRAACIGHDLAEDTPCTPDVLKNELVAMGFSATNPLVIETIDLIVQLTDVYVKEKYPNLNRKKRKELERERLGKISPKGKSIKLCDLLDNTRSIIEHDKDFANIYLREKIALLPYLADGSPVLLQQASVQTIQGLESIGIKMPVVQNPNS
jgi:(p)ppGpp synthase/HD superfamily hydrolase